MDVVHLAIIAFGLRPWFEHDGLLTFGAVYLAHASVPCWLALAIRRRWPAPRSFWGKLLLGTWPPRRSLGGNQGGTEKQSRTGFMILWLCPSVSPCEYAPRGDRA
jgi:hypothetical protein